MTMEPAVASPIRTICVRVVEHSDGTYRVRVTTDAGDVRHIEIADPRDAEEVSLRAAEEVRRAVMDGHA